MNYWRERILDPNFKPYCARNKANVTIASPRTFKVHDLPDTTSEEYLLDQTTTERDETSVHLVVTSQEDSQLPLLHKVSGSILQANDIVIESTEEVVDRSSPEPEPEVVTKFLKADIDGPKRFIPRGSLRITKVEPPSFDDGPVYDKNIDRKGYLIAQAVPVFPGAVSGHAVFNNTDAVNYSKLGKPCILIKARTSAEDMPGIQACDGLLTMLGGFISHAAREARLHNKHAVVNGSVSGLSIEGECVMKNGKICIKKDQVSVCITYFRKIWIYVNCYIS
jgi:phosphohistidine swiveling domain-containing protein